MLKNTEKSQSNEEENKTSAIINNLTDGLLVFSKDGKLLLVNPKTEKLFKIKKEKIVGKSIKELSEITIFCPLTEILEEKLKKIKRKTFIKEIKINNNLILSVNLIPIADQKEKSGMLVILHDISREKLIEQMKTEFVSLAAHQLRTPLSIIKWIIKMFLDGDLGKINKEQKEFLKSAYNSNQRMIKLIDNLLNVARIEEGRYISETKSVDIEKIIQELIGLYKKTAKRKGLKISFKKPKNKPPLIKLDAEKIKIAISNLIENAVKYTLKGGRVTVFLKYDKKKIEVSIKDTGVGIPENQQKRIFTKFFRAANVVKIDTTGSGLGLYIAKNIIKAHGGKIWFESKENKGATFYFTLPIK